MKINRLKLIVACVAGLYFLWCAWDPFQWHFIDGPDLLIHEAGHVIFHPFGEFLMIAGGSLFQVMVPALFVGYFYYNQRPYSGALVLFWVGESTLNVSVYAGDSVAMRLPLLGGDDSVHDWNYMLDHLSLLDSTAAISGAIRFAGTAIIIIGIVLALKYSWDNESTTANPQDTGGELFVVAKPIGNNQDQMGRVLNFR